MSKESRRRQRQTGQVPASGTTSNPPATGNPAAPARSTGPRGTERAGRRDRVRPVTRPSVFQRYRTIILAAAVIAVLAVVGAGLVSTATAPTYACSTVWQPDPTASPASGASQQPGYVQPDMGPGPHVGLGTKVTYTYCPPASGRHYNGAGVGPIAARAYGPGDTVSPQGRVHNLEHGGLVILYRGADVDEAALRALFDTIPASPVCGFEPGGQSPGPVIARFDEMAWPFAVLVWDRVMPLDTLDQQAILDFYATFGERTNPEQLCSPPSASPDASAEPSGSAAPSASAAAPSAAASGSAGPAASPSAGPS